MNKRIKEIALQNSIEVTWQEACYFGFFILLSVTKGLGLYEGQKLFELLVIPAFFLGAVKLAITGILMSGVFCFWPLRCLA